MKDQKFPLINNKDEIKKLKAKMIFSHTYLRLHIHLQIRFYFLKFSMIFRHSGTVIEDFKSGLIGFLYENMIITDFIKRNYLDSELRVLRIWPLIYLLHIPWKISWFLQQGALIISGIKIGRVRKVNSAGQRLPI